GHAGQSRFGHLLEKETLNTGKIRHDGSLKESFSGAFIVTQRGRKNWPKSCYIGIALLQKGRLGS
ncbi:MAG: hypothetical protein AAGU05_04230, partial [Anaerolineaceae bacterium]